MQRANDFAFIFVPGVAWRRWGNAKVFFWRNNWRRKYDDKATQIEHAGGGEVKPLRIAAV
jgi:hypothetical protein